VVACYPGDIRERPVRIRAVRHDTAVVDVAEDDSSGRFDALMRLWVRHPAALAVADRHAQHGAAQPSRERRLVALRADAHPVAAIREVGVSDERAGKKTGLAEDLKTVAASQDRAALGREAAKLLRSGRKLRDRARAQVVAIAEATGDDRGVEPAKIHVLMPLDLRL